MVIKKFVLSLVIIVLLSLFFIITKYHETIANATITRQQLSLLDTLNLLNADERLVQLSASGNIKAWLHLAKYRADSSGDIAYQLAEYFRQHKQVNTAELWYQVAIRQHHVASRLALAKIYFDLQQYAEIKALLLPVVSDDNALAILMELALQQGDLTFIHAQKNRLAQGENTKLYRELMQYDVFNSRAIQRHMNGRGDDKIATQGNKQSEHSNAKNSACLVDVQLFATNLAGLRHGQQLISAFADHMLAQYICLNPVKYIVANALNCQHLAIEKISCNATTWLDRKDITTRYLGIIVEQGGANVDNGIMYIDQNDTLDVLVHELSHFIGFVDEYPLPSQHQKCLQRQQAPFAHNIVVLSDYYQGGRKQLRKNILSQLPWRSLIKDSTPIFSRHQQGWKLGTPLEYHDEIGVFSANSCDKQMATHAYKPLSQRTKLQYFELLLPKRYLDIMLLGPNLYLMPSYHFNVSRDLAIQGEYIKAREVLQATLFD